MACREFQLQAHAAATGKARSPIVDRRIDGTCSKCRRARPTLLLLCNVTRGMDNLRANFSDSATFQTLQTVNVNVTL